MRYFGEHKKGTLTLAWSLANRFDYVACHGGMKRYNLENGKSYTIGVFGLSGSGKSTLTHEKHDGRYDISILHDDAYIINTNDLSSIALEPTYFDKMQDYPVEHPANEFLLTLQNVGVTMDEDGRKVVLAEDVRNNNGRAIKSQFWTDNRVNYVDQPVNAIVWLMKDKTLPPILKIMSCFGHLQWAQHWRHVVLLLKSWMLTLIQMHLLSNRMQIHSVHIHWFVTMKATKNYSLNVAYNVIS